MTRMNLIMTVVLTMSVTTLSGQYRTGEVPAADEKDTSAVVITLDDVRSLRRDTWKIQPNWT